MSYDLPLGYLLLPVPSPLMEFWASSPVARDSLEGWKNFDVDRVRLAPSMSQMELYYLEEFWRLHSRVVRVRYE